LKSVDDLTVKRKVRVAPPSQQPSAEIQKIGFRARFDLAGNSAKRFPVQDSAMRAKYEKHDSRVKRCSIEVEISPTAIKGFVAMFCMIVFAICGGPLGALVQLITAYLTVKGQPQ
jgi:hypothetical protein